MGEAPNYEKREREAHPTKVFHDNIKRRIKQLDQINKRHLNKLTSDTTVSK
jgi:hypothetical protein